MPQVWLTYEELGALLECDEPAARAVAMERPLSRRRCHDGRTRAKLDLLLMERFLDDLAQRWAERQVAACVDDLRAVHERMARAAAELELPSGQKQTA